jgi:hypothetical protein
MNISKREKSNINLSVQNEATKQAVDDLLTDKISAIETLLKARLKNPIGDLKKCTTLTKILAHEGDDHAFSDYTNKRSSLYEDSRDKLKERYSALAQQVKYINEHQSENDGISEDELEAELAEKTKDLQSDISGLCSDIYIYKNQLKKSKSDLLSANNQLDNERAKVKTLRAQLAKQQNSSQDNIIKIGDK